MDPKHERARGNVLHYQKSIAEEEIKLKKKQRREIGQTEEEEKPEQDGSVYAKERKVYESPYLGEMDIPHEFDKRLKCWYETKNHPFLKIAPIKVEQMYISLDIFIFYEVMSDAEIEYIKEMAKPRFKRAVVQEPKTGELVPANYRISKSAWLRDVESAVTARVLQLVSDMTGLSMLTAEELQLRYRWVL